MKKLIQLLAVLSLMACKGSGLDQVFKPSSPYETYLRHLTNGPLEKAAFVRDWKLAGDNALKDSTLVSLPYQELGYLDPAKPNAFMLRFPVEEGQELQISFTPISEPDAQVFLDLFELQSNGDLKRQSSAEESLQIVHRVRRSGKFALRVQPEVLRGGVFQLDINFAPTLAFPLPEKSSANIASFYGAPRDGGGRQHEGVDIFAPRGTPALAVGSGRISRVGNNRLGGKTVSLSSEGYSFYYAHLDSQLVSFGQEVKLGDTLGWVGNTGNAITTAPHLHFGIYIRGRGSLDPLPFLKSAPALSTVNVSDSTDLGEWTRIVGNLVNFRQSPSTSSPVIGQLKKNTALLVEGKAGDWYRVRLPNQKLGFVSSTLLESADGPLNEFSLGLEDNLKSTWSGPVYQSEFETGKATIHGEYADFHLVRTIGGRMIWRQVI
ncbi:M23 family metallopeptidase [Pararhodonellum marinum]|uniref:M23 family metallopeptidase n=1 Tax=Pararhodonellum marinum TaxID=2755358 RepID=UPI00188F604E|nr:M23 family metallopeptidase [Pararhodonellum marinum]